MTAQTTEDRAIADATQRALNLRHAVACEDRERVAKILQPLAVDDLFALAVVLAAQAPPSDTPNERLEAVLMQACSAFGTNTDHVRTQSKRREDLDARAVVSLAAHLLGSSYSQTGRFLGRDHTTVINAVGRASGEPRLRRVAHRIAANLGWDPSMADDQDDLLVSA